jgi:hypothetical protein
MPPSVFSPPRNGSPEIHPPPRSGNGAPQLRETLSRAWKDKDFEKIDGLIPMYRKGNRLLGELGGSQLNRDFIVLISIAKGIGKDQFKGPADLFARLPVGVYSLSANAINFKQSAMPRVEVHAGDMWIAAYAGGLAIVGIAPAWGVALVGLALIGELKLGP